MYANIQAHICRQLASSIANFPFDVVHALHYPMTAINLYVPRADITFDNFRVSEAASVAATITDFGFLFSYATRNLFRSPLLSSRRR